MNTFGRLFCIHIFGESHGEVVGFTLDGCPAGIELSEKDFEKDLAKRKSGARGTTPRIEEDRPLLKTGVFNGRTTGAPLTILFENKNVRSQDYSQLPSSPRPGHADFVAYQKFGGFNDYRGGGHFSGRLTVALVAAGTIAKKIITPISITSKLIEVYGKTNIDEAIEKAIAEHDSVGGIIECRAKNISIGLGEPFFDSVESCISHIVFAVPAVKGIEFGSGFAATRMMGSEHNDEIVDKKGRTKTNNAGGINGGITNGNELVFRVAIKPSSSIGKVQKTYNFEEERKVKLEVQGRHDACIALRAPIVIESACAIALADFYLLELKKG